MYFIELYDDETDTWEPVPEAEYETEAEAQDGTQRLIDDCGYPATSVFRVREK